MSFFRQRIWGDPVGNVPQMESGYVSYVTGTYRKVLPTLNLDSSVPAVAEGAVFVAGATASSSTSLALDSAVPGVSVLATSP